MSKFHMEEILHDKFIYHITHINNLESIVTQGVIFSPLVMVDEGLSYRNIGIDEIKNRRNKIPVTCYPKHVVGEFVPFYFCPRSVMLYVIYCENNPDLAYKDGQEPIVHLEAKLDKVIKWANENRVKWAFTRTNAGAYYTLFYNNINDLKEIDWQAIKANDFRDKTIKENKQAEFLVYRFFPWELIDRVGVCNRQVEIKVKEIFVKHNLSQKLEVREDWYF